MLQITCIVLGLIILTFVCCAHHNFPPESISFVTGQETVPTHKLACSFQLPIKKRNFF